MRYGGSFSEVIQGDKLESLAVSVLLDGLAVAHGGVGANIAYSLALLGDKPILLGSVGEDAKDYIIKLHDVGVDVAQVHESGLPTASFSVITDKNQSQIGGFYPGAMGDSGDLSLAPWKDKKPLVVVSPHDPAGMKRQVAECRKWGLKLCYDPGQQVTSLTAEDLREGVETAEILILNDYELSVLARKTKLAAAEIKRMVPLVVVTRGKHGSTVAGKNMPKELKIGVAKPDAEVDPTGAGDAFRSGFLYGFGRGWPPNICAQLGAVTGSFALEHNGTQNHHFTFEQVAARYEENFGGKLPQ